MGAAFADPDGKMDAGETYVIFGPLSTTTAAAPTTTPTGTPTSTPATPPLLEPGPENQVLPLSGKPFSGDFWYGSIFDHNLPLQWGEDFNEFVLTWWGETSSVNYDTHMGIDWVMPEGTPILAVADGEVVFAGIDPPGACPPLGVDATDQQRIILLHFAENGMRFTSSYLHGSTIDVQLGEAVSAGQQIALSGNTGCSTEPHLHFHVGRLGDTNSGEPALVDPYGWESDQTDPWSQHPDGAESIWLWKEGQAPPIYAGYAIPPNPFGGSSPVALTVFRWMGPRDSESPNNEMLQLELDPRYAPSGEYDLTGFSIHNIRGDSFLFPDDFLIGQDQPVWLFTGSGTSTDTVLYWGRSEGVWDNTRDCAFLAWPDGSTMYHLRTSDTCDALPAQTPPSVPGLTGPALVGMALLMSALALWRLRMPARRSGGRDARNELGRALE